MPTKILICTSYVKLAMQILRLKVRSLLYLKKCLIFESGNLKYQKYKRVEKFHFIRITFVKS